MELIVPFMSFVLVSTITPGPNNVLLATSGVKFGFRATVPHMAGIHCGIYLLVVLCGLGLGQILLSAPNVLLGMKIFGTLYLLYLAGKIAGIRWDKLNVDAVVAPMSFLEASVFQFTNPKAWMMATNGLALAFAVSQTMTSAVLFLCAGFATVGLICNCLWILMGTAMQDAWTVPVMRFWINLALASLTLASAIMFWVF